ncbi:LytR family transcriptional regulator [Gordonia oryzae]|uniref:LytR family transcriptional regulator n=1 Tax=Gordonia oryzae TaxID=2487349 RepID=A0A3N4GUR0_9ACTN|nr:LCP family protein [Gordonia oryzae]RPA62350.1 LytR family transcriptional regulator [Gordonia oryzae]
MASEFDRRRSRASSGHHRAGRPHRLTAGEVYRRAAQRRADEDTSVWTPVGGVTAAPDVSDHADRPGAGPTEPRPTRRSGSEDPTRPIPTTPRSDRHPSPQLPETAASTQDDGTVGANSGVFRTIPVRGGTARGSAADRDRVRRRAPRRTASETVRASRGRRRAIGLARAAVLVCSVVAFVVCGAMWMGVSTFHGGLGYSNVLQGAPRSTDGTQNILLIGLDTRKDKNGNDLPADVMRQLHAGDGDSGGYNTNTLILMHIPADRKNIVAYSIPRDDLVETPDLDVSQAKIKEVYGRTKAATEDQLAKGGISDPATLEAKGRDAGRTATIKAVRTLTGVPIDRFAEVSLIGFYDVAKALGGVEVCLNHAVSDDYSGANFSSGMHRLSASQALAFVRQRHGLTRGDLDRTHRQQAFLLSALHQVQSAGTLTDVGKLNRLMSVVDDDVVFSQGWDVVSWAQDMIGVPDQKISFQTLPVVRYATVDDQDVNIIDPVAIRAEVQRAFGVPVTASAPSSSGASESAASPESGSAATPSTDDSSDGAQNTSADNSGPAPDSGPAVVNTSTIPCVD